jgi:hypothetical protein
MDALPARDAEVGPNTSRSASCTRASQVITSSTAWISLAMR